MDATPILRKLNGVDPKKLRHFIDLLEYEKLLKKLTQFEIMVHPKIEIKLQNRAIWIPSEIIKKKLEKNKTNIY